MFGFDFLLPWWCLCVCWCCSLGVCWGTAPALESLLPLFADSPEPLLELPGRALESLLPLRCDSTELRRRSVDATITVSLVSLLFQIRAISAAIVLPDSRRDFVDADFTPESAEDSRRFRYEPESVGLDHGKDRARSASVSRRTRGLLPRVFAGCPLHSRKMSVSWASEERRRRADTGGDVSWVSVGGEMLVICAEESRRPAPRRLLRVDSSTCSLTMSSQPLPPCHTSPTWWLRIGKLQTKQMAVIVLQQTGSVVLDLLYGGYSFHSHYIRHKPRTLVWVSHNIKTNKKLLSQILFWFNHNPDKNVST